MTRGRQEILSARVDMLDKADDGHAPAADVPDKAEAVMAVGHVPGIDAVDSGGRRAIVATPRANGPTSKKVRTDQDISNDLLSDGGGRLMRAGHWTRAATGTEQRRLSESG